MKKQIVLFTLLLCVLCSCDDTDNTKNLRENQLKRGWKLNEWKINGAGVDLSEITLTELMFFGEQHLCYTATPLKNGENWEYNDKRTAWNYDVSNSILNISALLPITIYVDNISEEQLNFHFYKYDTEGNLDLHEKTFTPAEVEIINLKLRLKE